jgi:hypothetical protein
MNKLFEDEEFNLKETLFKAYGWIDKRVTKIEKMDRFRVDECEIKKGANGQPLSSVITMYANVKGASEIELFISGVPREGPVKEWVEKVGPTFAKMGMGTITITLKPGDQAKLDDLAEAFFETVAPGRRYDTPSFKHSCPETASGLQGLEKVLDGIWRPKPKAAKKKK